MTATRPMQIYQDPSVSLENPNDIFSVPVSAPPPSVSFHPETIDKAVLHPPPSLSSARSPRKSVRPLAGPPRVVFGDRQNVSLPPPKDQPFPTDSPAKRTTGSAYQPIAPSKLPRPIFTSFPVKELDKENARSNYCDENVAEFPDPTCGYKTVLKRPSSAMTPSSLPPSKRPTIAESPIEIPDPEDLSTPEDDGKKPVFSYATLIGMAILRAPNRRLTLAQIYKWISDHFSHYKADDPGWKNSIRHNLSLCKSFEKKERTKDDPGPGKGNFWTIVPGDEAQFLRKDKPSRRSASAASSIKISSDMSSSPWPMPRLPTAGSGLRSTELQEPSSDATIPASDLPSHEEEQDSIAAMPPPTSHAPLSSPLRDLQSSPPIVHSPLLLDFSQPPMQDIPLPSAHNSRSKRTKFASMDDSGYFSSLGSSTTKPSTTDAVMDRGRSRPRRGRAEEEIARIRSSSHDLSPIKGRSSTSQPVLQLVSSSPARNVECSLMLPPLTPGKTFPMPLKPPASISPNTNLRNHRNRIRELVGSPVKSFDLLNDQITFSPAFKIHEDETYDGFGSSFNGLTPKLGLSPALFFPSPDVRSARRQRLTGPAKSSRVLADVTGASLNSNSLLQVPHLASPLKHRSPEESPTTWLGRGQENDLFGSILFDEDEENDEVGGMDLLQGFAKIGGPKKATEAQLSKASRPALGARSQTSRF